MIFAKFLYSESGQKRMRIDARMMQKVLFTVTDNQARRMLNSIPEKHIVTVFANPHIEEHTQKKLTRYDDAQGYSIQMPRHAYRAVDLKLVMEKLLRKKGL